MQTSWPINRFSKDANLANADTSLLMVCCNEPFFFVKLRKPSDDCKSISLRVTVQTTGWILDYSGIKQVKQKTVFEYEM